MSRQAKARARRLDRLVRAQDAMALSERLARAEAEAARAHCEADSEALLGALSSQTTLFGMLLPTMARMLQANAKEAARYEKRAAAAKERETAETLRAVRIAEHAKSARRDDRKQLEMQRLEEIGVAWTPAAALSGSSENEGEAGTSNPFDAG